MNDIKTVIMRFKIKAAVLMPGQFFGVKFLNPAFADRDELCVTYSQIE